MYKFELSFFVIITIYIACLTYGLEYNEFSLYDLDDHTLAQEPLAEGHEILVNPFLVIITLLCLNHAPE